MIDIITVCLQIFFIIIFAAYFIYAAFIFPVRDRVPKRILGAYESFTADYLILSLILSAFIIIHKIYLPIDHALFRAIRAEVLFSLFVLIAALCGRALSFPFRRGSAIRLAVYSLSFSAIFAAFTYLFITRGYFLLSL